MVREVIVLSEKQITWYKKPRAWFLVGGNQQRQHVFNVYIKDVFDEVCVTCLHCLLLLF